jgi:hypothetical protein
MERSEMSRSKSRADYGKNAALAAIRTRGRIKNIVKEAREGDKHGYTGAERKVYSCFSRARDLLYVISFFLL